MGKHRVAVGGTYEYNLGITQKNYVFGQPPFFLSDESSWLAAAYSEVELSLAPKLRVNAGGRFDWYSTFGGALSPRVAFIYSPASRTTLKYIFGRAFRAPNAYEEYYRDGVAITAAPGQLKPEKIQSHEIVVEHSFVPWLSVTADGYYNQLEKLIDQVPDPNTGLTYFVNSGRVHSKGLEFEVLAQHSSGVAARASYTLSRAADDVSRTSSANSPLSQAKLNATVPMWGRGFTGVELLYSGAMQDYRGTRVPPYLLTNLTLSSRPLWGGWDFSASCYNALNRRWFSPMGPNDPEAAILQDGRTYRFKVSYRLPLGGHR
jgi:iron complex outermembrane receptor protein